MTREEEHAPERARLSGRRIRTLVVDDFPLAVQALVAFVETHARLELAGTARQGAEAVALAGTLQPDLVLMDRRMPVMDGFEATRRLKAHPHAPRVILVTIDVRTVVGEAAAAVGADGLVFKAELYEQLPSLIETLFPSNRL